MMNDYLVKMFAASMPINAHDDNRLKLVVYGNAYFELLKLKNYSVINVNEQFINNEKAEVRTLQVRITLEEIEDKKERWELN